MNQNAKEKKLKKKSVRKQPKEDSVKENEKNKKKIPITKRGKKHLAERE